MVTALLLSIATGLLSLVLWPFLLLVTLINEFGRIFVGTFLLPKNYKLNEQCFGNFLWSDMFNTRMVVVALYSPDSIELSKDVQRFQQVLQSKSMHYSNLKNTHVGKSGYGCLRDDTRSFEVSNHVKIFDAAVPKNQEYFTEQELCREILPEYVSCDMDESKPQWEWLVFPRIQRDDGTFHSLRVFRFDHRYMDGACAGVFMAECIFDNWTDTEDKSNPVGAAPPYVYNPKCTPPNQEWWFVAKIWAFLNLPVILALSLVDLFTLKEGKGVDKPFTTWTNTGRKVFSRIHSVDVRDVTTRFDANGKKYSLKTILLTLLAPVLKRSWAKLYPEKSDCDSNAVNVAGFQALPPYKSGVMSNQFTIVQANVPLKNIYKQKVIDYPIDMTFFFANVYTHWIGRLPIWWIRKLAAPADATVVLNSVPYLRKLGSICGSQITEIASWDLLYTPVGLDITIMGYGGKMFVSAFSVEECMSFEQIDDLVKNYVIQLKG